MSKEELINRAKQWHMVAQSFDFELYKKLYAEEWAEYQATAPRSIQEAQEASDCLFVGLGLQLSAKTPHQTCYADEKVNRAYRIVDALGYWPMFVRVVESNFTKFMPEDTPAVTLESECQRIESEGRYTGVHWKKRGNYIVLLSKDGKILKPSTFRPISA